MHLHGGIADGTSQSPWPTIHYKLEVAEDTTVSSGSSEKY